jgi:hypothetical protein
VCIETYYLGARVDFTCIVGARGFSVHKMVSCVSAWGFVTFSPYFSFIREEKRVCRRFEIVAIDTLVDSGLP